MCSESKDRDRRCRSEAERHQHLCKACELRYTGNIFEQRASDRTWFPSFYHHFISAENARFGRIGVYCRLLPSTLHCLGSGVLPCVADMLDSSLPPLAAGQSRQRTNAQLKVERTTEELAVRLFDPTYENVLYFIA